MNAQAQELLAAVQAEQRPLLRFQLLSRLRGALDVSLEGTGPDATLHVEAEHAMIGLVVASLGSSAPAPTAPAPKAGFWRSLFGASTGSAAPTGQLMLPNVTTDEAAAVSMIQQLPARLLPRLLSHADPVVRTATARSMMPEAAVREQLERQVEAELDPTALAAMAAVLGRMTSAGSVRALKAALVHAATPEARRAVATALARASPSDRKAFARSSNVDDRLALAAGLSNTSEVAELLDDPEPRVVLAALEGLPALRDEALNERLTRLTAPPQPAEVRLAALHALTKAGWLAAAGALEVILREAIDPQSPLRAMAHTLLETISRQRSLNPAGLDALRAAEPRLDPTATVARAAVRRLLARDEPNVEPTDPRHAELFARVDANRDDQQAWLVLGDALQADGDVRGELIALSSAGKPTDAVVKAHLPALLGRAADLLGPRAGALLEGASWRRGLLEEVTVKLRDDDGSVTLAQLAAATVSAPLARFLTGLRVGLTDEESSENDYRPVLEALQDTGCAPRLRSLVLGEFEYPEQTEISWTPWGDVSSVWKVLPNLEHVHLRGAGGDLGKQPRAEKLQRLVIETGGLSRETFDSVVTLAAPSLEHLEVWFGADAYGAECTADDLARLLARTDLPRLRHLGVRNAEFLAEAIGELASSALLRQLTSLDFSLGVLGDEGLELLERHAKAFAHLERFDFTGNNFSDAGQARLVALLHQAIVADQRSDDERYASVGE